MMKCKINYLPISENVENNGVVTNFIVKRIFVAFKLYLQIWKNIINIEKPEESTAEMVHESHVNDVSGIETDPNFIWMKFIENNQTLVWFTIESNWLDDTTEIYANECILKEDDFTVKKK